jgi:energy-coupling factor transporter ATP-binding protein EcfA2
MWRPFDMELVKEYKVKTEGLDAIKNHLLILCGNDKSVYDYFEKWIAQMIQFPAIKTTCPVLISKEGAGKGTLLQLLTKMLGSTKVFETTQPSRDVWGEFNGLMADAFLVNLNELSKKETIESEGRIKGLITDSTLKINNKGIAQFPIESFHRFIITTNNENPIATTQDDRRKLIIRSSDEKCGDKEYFNKLYGYLSDINVIKTCYEYFKSIDGMDKFNNIPLPVTEFQKDLKQLSTSPIESFMKDFVLENYYEKEPIKLHGKEIFALFNSWLKKCGLEYSCNIQAFGLRLKNLKINGITKGAHSKQGEANLFDIPAMKKHFNLDTIVFEQETNSAAESKE